MIAAPIPDLHALANTPGFGRANKTLREYGLWNEDAIEQPRRWRVRVSGRQTVRVAATVTVEADTQAAAIDMAEKNAAAADRWHDEFSDYVEVLAGESVILDVVAL